jgi:hypothetical protein
VAPARGLCVTGIGAHLGEALLEVPVDPDRAGVGGAADVAVPRGVPLEPESWRAVREVMVAGRVPARPGEGAGVVVGRCIELSPTYLISMLLAYLKQLAEDDLGAAAAVDSNADVWRCRGRPDVLLRLLCSSRARAGSSTARRATTLSPERAPIRRACGREARWRAGGLGPRIGGWTTAAGGREVRWRAGGGGRGGRERESRGVPE